MKKIFVALTLLTLISCCGKPTLDDLKDTQWQLVEIPGKEFNYDAIKDGNYTILFTSNAMGGIRIEGVGDCSPFRMETTIYPELESIKVNHISLNRGECDSFEQEDLFTKTIRNADFYSIEGDEMELYDGRLLTMKLRRVGK